MSKEEKKRRKAGILVAFVFHVALVILLFSFKVPEPELVSKPELIVFDFSGSSASGGSSASKSKAKSETNTSKADPVKTQKSESPVTKAKSTTKSTTSSNNTPKVNKNATAGSNTFGGNKGNGSGNSDGDGSDNGEGEGVGGPGIEGKIGKLGSRKRIYTPKVNNPVKEEGKVAVEVTVLRSGKVESARVLRTHSKTTTNNTSHYSEAKKEALKFVFAKNPSGKEFEKGIIVINFILQ
jgi:hypothetical protein